MAVGIKINPADLAKVKTLLVAMPKAQKNVIRRGINRTLTGVRTDMVQAAYDQYNLTKTRIRKNFFIRNATFANLSGRVGTAGKPVPMIDYTGTKALKRGGVSVKILRSGTRLKMLHAFIATMPSGHRGVFERRESIYYGRRYRSSFPYATLPRPYKLPIDQLHGPRIEDAFADKARMRIVEEKAQIRFDKNISNELDFELSRI